MSCLTLVLIMEVPFHKDQLHLYWLTSDTFFSKSCETCNYDNSQKYDIDSSQLSNFICFVYCNCNFYGLVLIF